MKVDLLDEGIDRYLDWRGFGLIPKYYGHPVVIGSFSPCSNVRRDALRGVADGSTTPHLSS